jgi:hypothetical protein
MRGKARAGGEELTRLTRETENDNNSLAATYFVNS